MMKSVLQVKKKKSTHAEWFEGFFALQTHLQSLFPRVHVVFITVILKEAAG